ncbi:MAG: ExbD/TolR family protein [bacterium]
MAFQRRAEDNRTIEFTSLIDIVFLLLIFFLISFGFSLPGRGSDTRNISQIALPETHVERTVVHEDILENLMIQIVPDTNQFALSRRVFVLWPALEGPRKISVDQAFRNALSDSTFALYPDNFLKLSQETFQDLDASKLITQSIKKYIELRRLHNKDSHSVLEIKAEKNTRYKILSFIMDQCSSYKEAIPQLIIRTMS